MKRLSLFSIIVFVLSYGLLTGIHQIYHANHHAFIKSESQAIQNQIEERFKLYVRSTLAIKNIADEFWKRPLITSKEFHALGATVNQIYPEFIGANFVRPDGLITLVHPTAKNSAALGKKSQNIAALRNVGNQNDGVWMSPPLNLFQGEEGFVYYFRLKKENELLGWYGIVLSKILFKNYFITNKQFQNFHINMNDEETGRSYLSTSPIPEELNKSHLLDNSFQVLGRTINLKTWPKNSSVLQTEWIFITLLALLFSFISTIAWNFFFQKKNFRIQINELNELLNNIIQDTSKSVASIKRYVELMREDPKLVPVDKLTRNVSFVVHLVDQIQLVRGLAETDTSWELSNQPLLPLVSESVDFISERLNEKELTLDYDPEILAAVQVNVNQNLFVDSVLSKIFSTVVNIAKQKTIITMQAQNNDEKSSLILMFSSRTNKLEKSEEISLQIAKKVMEIQGGRLDYSHSTEWQIKVAFS